MAKQKMQHVNFSSVEELLDYLPDDELKVVEFLRKLIYSCMPDVTEYLSYNVPYYKMHKGICFLWPASILWGSKKTYTGVRMGFIQGHLLSDDSNYLDKTNRKQVYMKDFNSIKEIDVDIVRAFLFEALLIDRELAKAKREKTVSERKTK